MNVAVDPVRNSFKNSDKTPQSRYTRAGLALMALVDSPPPFYRPCRHDRLEDRLP
jgi:hypothetical protein